VYLLVQSKSIGIEAELQFESRQSILRTNLRPLWLATCLGNVMSMHRYLAVTSQYSRAVPFRRSCRYEVSDPAWGSFPSRGHLAVLMGSCKPDWSAWGVVRGVGQAGPPFPLRTPSPSHVRRTWQYLGCLGMKRSAPWWHCSTYE
jgi:hypothetical protein